MQAQATRTKGELLFEFRTKIVSTTIKDISPTGMQVEINHQGEVSGKLHGGTIATVSSKVKTDMSYEWQAKSIINTKEGDLVASWGDGKGRHERPQTSSWEGELRFMTPVTPLILAEQLYGLG